MSRTYTDTHKTSEKNIQTATTTITVTAAAKTNIGNRTYSIGYWCMYEERRRERESKALSVIVPRMEQKKFIIYKRKWNKTYSQIYYEGKWWRWNPKQNIDRNIEREREREGAQQKKTYGTYMYSVQLMLWRKKSSKPDRIK